LALKSKASIAFVLLALVAACHKQADEPVQAPAPGPASQPAPAAEPAQPAPPSTTDPNRLPEDTAAAKRSEQQWREHMQDEEDERQLGFDKLHLKEHRALIKLIAAARARYDHAHGEAALVKTRADVQASVTEMRKRVTQIDHWGVNSRLLPDYAALIASLEAAYPDAALAATKGDAHALDQVRSDFDQRMKKIATWLERAAESEEESG
jgi:hypothetical protein